MTSTHQRRIAADLLKCGTSRVRIADPQAMAEALTREDIRGLIAKGAIVKLRKKGTSRAGARTLLVQKAKGRRSGRGTRKGARGARSPRKRLWIRSVRGMRRELIGLKDRGEIAPETFTQLYSRIKGGAFRSKRHLLSYISENSLRRKK